MTPTVQFQDGPTFAERLSTVAGLSEFPHDLYRVVFAQEYDQEKEADRVTADLNEANVISSSVNGTGMHTVMLDLDVPAKLVPSSTPGHSHLYIDVPMEWEKYKRLLEVLADCGILEPGYVGASIERGHTALRLPWVSKEGDPSTPSKPIDDKLLPF